MDKKYYAFISYKREDLKEAEWLRNKLSHYHFPSKLRKENNSLPKAIRPLFRDSLELAGGFLAKEIETALSESKYIIVICSPRSAKSPWVNKEVEYFIEHGREEYIIPYIIDGEPFSKDPSKECFPPALRALKGEKELLGISTSELDKEAAAVKVVARMFGLRFDALWQGYNREQKKRRITWGTAAVFALLLSVSVSAILYKNNNEISRQKQFIESQNKELIKTQEIVQLEKKAFSYITVNGYVRNFLMPVIEYIKTNEPESHIYVHMPTRSKDLNHDHVDRFNSISAYVTDILMLDTIKQVTLKTRMLRGLNVHRLCSTPDNVLDGKYLDFASTTSTFLTIAKIKKEKQIYKDIEIDAIIEEYTDIFISQANELLGPDSIHVTFITNINDILKQ